jgi:hypothetical protein
MAQIFWKYLTDEFKTAGRRTGRNDFRQARETVIQNGPGWVGNAHQELFKRGTPDYGYCLSGKELEAFDNIGW